MTLTRDQLAERLNAELGVSKREAKGLVATFFEEMSAALESGESVRLPGFGDFQLRGGSEP